MLVFLKSSIYSLWDRFVALITISIHYLIYLVSRLRPVGKGKTKMDAKIFWGQWPIAKCIILYLFSEAKALIDSPSNKEVHVKQRSQVKLTCAVDMSNSGMFWHA